MATPMLRLRHAGHEAVVSNRDVAIIGSGDDVTFPVRRPGISRRHAEVRFVDDHWVVRDTKSTNGTYADGRALDVMPIAGPVTLRLGHPQEGEVVELEPVDGDVTRQLQAAASRHPETRPDAVQRLTFALWGIAAAILFLGIAIIVAAVIT